MKRERERLYIRMRDVFDYERTLCDSLMLKVNSAADELVDELTELSCTLTLNCKLALTR